LNLQERVQLFRSAVEGAQADFGHERHERARMTIGGVFQNA